MPAYNIFISSDNSFTNIRILISLEYFGKDDTSKDKLMDVIGCSTTQYRLKEYALIGSFCLLFKHMKDFSFINDITSVEINSDGLIILD